VARQYFPGLLQSMPHVYLCSDDQIPDPRVGGIYTTGERAMRIPLRSTSQGNLTMTLAHELGHAETERRGLFDQSVQGHGVGWMRVMIEAGLGHEAQRTAAFFAGGGQAFQLAQQAVADVGRSQSPPSAGATGQRPDGSYARPTTRCVTRIEYLITDANGRRVEVQEFPGCAAK